MSIQFTDQVMEKYPELITAFVVSPMPVYSSDEERNQAVAVLVEEISQKYGEAESLTSHSYNQLYASFYKSMGLKVKKVSTPLKQAARILNLGTYRSINKLIDMCMHIEYTTLVSFQLYDKDKVIGDMEYSISTGTEKLTTFHGEEKNCKNGELILIDRDQALHSVYYGNNAKKSVSDNTKEAIIRIMGVPGIDRENFDHALELILKQLPGAHHGLLTKETSDISI